MKRATCLLTILSLIIALGIHATATDHTIAEIPDEEALLDALDADSAHMVIDDIYGSATPDHMTSTFMGITALSATTYYIDLSGNSVNVDATSISDIPTGIDGIPLGTAGTTSWYVVDADVTNTNRPTVQGDVHLILADGATWTADYSSGGTHWGGISVPSGNSLTIWGQTAGTGALNAWAYNGQAGIGGGIQGGTGVGTDFSVGTITINGGTVTANGGNNGAGIGGGQNSDNGTVIINGGTVTATGGGFGGAGIGGGSSNPAGTMSGGGGTITITGGDVTAFGNSSTGYGDCGSGAGIGGSGANNSYVSTNLISGGDSGLITIGGNAMINASGGNSTTAASGGGAGIGSGGGGGSNPGGGGSGAVDAIAIFGDAQVTAQGGTGATDSTYPAGGGAGIGTGGASGSGTGGTIGSIDINTTHTTGYYSPYTVNATGASGGVGSIGADIGYGGTATTPGIKMISSAPQALTAVQGASSITLSWTDSAVIGGGTLSYRIYISTNGGTTWSSETDVTGTSYAWSGLTYSTDYSFMVRAINTGSTVAGPQSNMQTSTPLSNTNAITSFTLTDGTTTWTGTINDQAGTVTATVPSGTDVTNLTPTIGTTGASIAPVSGIAQDFTNPQTYTVTAVDGRTRSYTVVVNSLIDAQTPEITGQPQSVTVYVGETAQLSVTSSVGDGGTLSYQWYLNISDSNSGGTAITDGTGTSAAFFAPTITTGIFYYYVVVTNTNNSATGSVTASVTSDVASVTVNPTPIIAPIVLPLVSGAWGGTDPNDPLWTYDSANNMLYVKSGEVIDISGTVSGNLQIVTSPGGAATVNAVGDVLLYSGDTLTLGAGVTLTVSDGAAIKNEGSLGNSGTINNTPNGVINNQPAGTINNQNGAEIINDGTINNEGTINNNGTMSGNGSLNNIDSGVVIAPPTGGNSGNGSGGNGSGSGDGGISAPAPAPPPAPGLAPPPVVPDDPQASDDTTDLTTPSTGHAPFVDISQSHWAQRDIDVLWSRGIMRGVSDTIFAPNEKLTEPCW